MFVLRSISSHKGHSMMTFCVQFSAKLIIYHVSLPKLRTFNLIFLNLFRKYYFKAPNASAILRIAISMFSSLVA